MKRCRKWRWLLPIVGAGAGACIVLAVVGEWDSLPSVAAAIALGTLWLMGVGASLAGLHDLWDRVGHD